MTLGLFGGRHRPLSTPTQSAAADYVERVAREAVKDALFRNFAAPVQRASVPQTVSGGPPVVFQTEGQLRRERAAEAEAVRKAAESRGGHVQIVRHARVVAVRKLDPNLSKNAMAALDYVLSAWQRAGKKPVQVLASDVARHANIRVEAARVALDELRGTGHLADVRDSYGVARILPTSKVTGSVE